MNCRCGARMKNVTVFDTGSGGNADGQSYAWNLYVCNSCGTIARENVWSHPGTHWVYYDDDPRS